MLEIIIWVSAIIRIVICFLPQNNWCRDEGNLKLSNIRNAVFSVTGIGVIILYAISGNIISQGGTRLHPLQSVILKNNPRLLQGADYFLSFLSEIIL